MNYLPLYFCAIEKNKTAPKIKHTPTVIVNKLLFELEL